jgi:hypothetical protein
MIAVCLTCGQKMLMNVPLTYAVDDGPGEIDMTDAEVEDFTQQIAAWMEERECPQCKTRTLRVPRL